MLPARSSPVQKRGFLLACICITPVQSGASPIQYFFRFSPWVPFQCYTNLTEETALQVAERVPFEAKWRLLARVGVRCYILISNVSGAVKVVPLQILQFSVILPHSLVSHCKSSSVGNTTAYRFQNSHGNGNSTHRRKLFAITN